MADKLKIASVTVGRSDFSIYRPVYKKILASPDMQLHLIAAAAHLSPEFGNTINVIEAEKIPVADRVPMTLGDCPAEINESIAMGVSGFSKALLRAEADLLFVLGDRYEMLAAVIAAMPLNLPVVHLHGGEATEGAMDEMIRHAITKMSHVHFASLPQYAAKIRQMGEAEDRIFITGAPALDNLRQMQLLDRAGLEKHCGIKLTQEFLLVVYHPVTLEHHTTDAQMDELLAALDAAKIPTLISYPNTDTRGRTIAARLREFTAKNPQHQLVHNLDPLSYYSTLNLAAAMVGNSSSGIIEAASFKLPVVNIGIRQQGRIAPPNVIHVDCNRNAIGTALAQATSKTFRDSLRDLINPYGDGHASERIIEILQSLPSRETLLRKKFNLIS